jgi:hypothetical protein
MSTYIEAAKNSGLHPNVGDGNYKVGLDADLAFRTKYSARRQPSVCVFRLAPTTKPSRSGWRTSKVVDIKSQPTGAIYLGT